MLYAATDAGIRPYKIDKSSGNLSSMPALTTGGDLGFGFPAASATGNVIYARDRKGDGINAYSVGTDGTLATMAGSPFLLPIAGSDFTGIAVDPKGRAVYAVNGIDEMISVFKVDSTTGALTAVPTPVPTGVMTWPQKGAVDPSGGYLYVSSTDTNLWDPRVNDYSGVLALSISQTGDLALTNASPFTMPSNAQPTDIAVDQTGTFVFVNLTNATAVAAFTRDPASGSLTPVNGSPFAAANTENPQTSAIAVHPSGGFVYAFNANGSTISAFTVNPTTGALTPVSGSPFAAPRGTPLMTVDPSGSFLYAVAYGPDGSHYNGMLRFKIDQGTGALSGASSSTLPEPVYNILSITAP
jgi:6-phosphogluconolactonase (cycloisomerase 2 family)